MLACCRSLASLSWQHAFQKVGAEGLRLCPSPTVAPKTSLIRQAVLRLPCNPQHPAARVIAFPRHFTDHKETFVLTSHLLISLASRRGEVCISPPFWLVPVVSFPSWPHGETRDSSKGLSLSFSVFVEDLGMERSRIRSSLLLSGLLNPFQTYTYFCCGSVWVKQKSHISVLFTGIAQMFGGSSGCGKMAFLWIAKK